MRPAASVTLAAVAVAAGLSAPLTAQAGAWTQPKGRGQVIVKFEDMRAERALDPDGVRRDLPSNRRDRVVTGSAEYGLSERLTLQLKGDWQDGEDAFVDYAGRGPVEIGVTWQAWRDDRSALSLYGG